jgi:hypothetical protein
VKINKQPVRFGGGSESDPVVTGTKYQIPFDGQYVKYDDGGKVFKWFNEDRSIIYSAQLHRGVWHCKVTVHVGNKALCPVEYIGRDEDRKVAWKQVREEIAEHRLALVKLPNFKS